jgi:hypothetical protein
MIEVNYDAWAEWSAALAQLNHYFLLGLQNRLNKVVFAQTHPKNYLT